MDARLAIQGFGQYPRHRRLADATGAGEQVGMVHPFTFERIDQGTDDMLLPCYLREFFAPPLAGQRQIAHLYI